MNGRLATAWSVVRIAVLAYAGYVALLFLLQRSVVFPGTRRDPPRPSPDDVPPGIIPLWLEPSFGRVEAWLLEAPGEGPGPALIFSHGNGELIDDWRDDVEPLRRAGVHVLLVEFPGYGYSHGAPSRRALREAFTAAFDALARHPRVDGNRIVAMGRSLGAGVASDLALERPVAGLVLLSTFTSAADMAWQAYKVPALGVRDRFDNRRALRRFDGPVLLLHGRRDRIIPFEHAERLAGLREDLEVIPLDCGHNDCLSAWPRVVESILAFLDQQGLR